MDIVEADELVKAHGYTERYLWVDVVWPMNVPWAGKQVLYVFEMENGAPGSPDVVSVGTRDRNVRASLNAGRVFDWLGGDERTAV